MQHISEFAALGGVCNTEDTAVTALVCTPQYCGVARGLNGLGEIHLRLARTPVASLRALFRRHFSFPRLIS